MRLAFVPVALASAFAAAPAGAAPVDYRATFEPDARALALEVCVEAAAALVRFEAAHADAGRYLLAVARSSGAAVERERGALVARDWQPGECLDYRVDLGAIARAGRRGLGHAFGRDLVAAPRSWLWRPTQHARDPDARITFTLPPGWSLSVPWTSLDASPPRRRFRLGTRPATWPALVAFGHFPEHDLRAGEGTIRHAALGDLDAAQRDVLQRFVAGTADDVAAVFPYAFAARPQVALVPVGAQRDAVPFGQSYRGGGDAIVLYVDPSRRLDDYFANWTLSHELVHLVHPYLGDEGRWISEGIATYFQNVVRARAGRITARRAWAELDAGFDRGRANPSDLTLRQTSRVMGERRLYMRAYWSGTALALAADLAWRTRAEAPTSLEAVLDRYAECCARARRRPEAGAFLDELDRIAGGAPVYGPLYRAHADQSAYPEPEAAYRTLGIARDGRELVFAPEGRALRRAIMGPGSP